MADKYTVHNVLLESADFYVLILEFPEEDINDRLSYLVHDKGLVYRHLYEDFLLTSCMANSGPFFFHIRKRPELLSKFAEIRKETLSLIYKYSPGFRPENIVINQNNVLKTKGTVKKEERVRPLVENVLWDRDPPLTGFGPAVIVNAPEQDDTGEDLPPIRDGDGEEETRFRGPDAVSDNPFAGGGNDRDEVPFERKGHKWDTAGVYINIRQYEENEDTLIKLLGGTPFESVRGYHLLVVELCVDDFSDVFHLLDKTGVSKKNKPEDLVAELYEIALIYNPFLRLEDIDLKEVRQEYRHRNRAKQRTNNRRMAAASGEELAPRRKGLKFSDLTNEKLLALAADMKKRIVGQDAALEHISASVHRASVGLKREQEPIGVLLFTGKTGVGKTETAKVLADALGAHMVRIDCQEYQQPHEVAKLAGSPPGYIGYDDGGHLTKELAKYPFSVVLFDEIEKAHSNFHERLLQIIDDGVLTEAKGGKKVPFNQALVIMTSNVGVKEVDSISRTAGFGEVAAQTDEKAAKAREEALKHKFKPEFLNRVDEIVHFRDLDNKDYTHVLDILLDEVNEQLVKSRTLSLKVTAGAKNFLLENGIDKKFGARPLRRAVKRYVSTPLARAILNKEIPGENGKITVSLKPRKDGLAFKGSADVKSKKEPAKEDS